MYIHFKDGINAGRNKLSHVNKINVQKRIKSAPPVDAVKLNTQRHADGRRL